MLSPDHEAPIGRGRFQKGAGSRTTERGRKGPDGLHSEVDQKDRIREGEREWNKYLSSSRLIVE